MHQKVLTLENKYELAELGTIFSRKAKLGTNHLPKTKKKQHTPGTNRQVGGHFAFGISIT